MIANENPSSFTARVAVGDGSGRRQRRNILSGAALNGKFSREALSVEVFGAPMKAVISTMSRMEGIAGSIGERFDKDARFLRENPAPTLMFQATPQKVPFRSR